MSRNAFEIEIGKAGILHRKKGVLSFPIENWVILKIQV